MTPVLGDDERLLFAYGSNMASRHLRRMCPSAEPFTRAELPNHRIAFRRYSTAFKGGVCTVEAAPGDLVRGVVYRVRRNELDGLDGFGDLASGLYRRQSFLVLGEGQGWLEADLHRAACPAGPFPPAPDYLALMIEGAREHDLGSDYVKALEELPGAEFRPAAECR